MEPEFIELLFQAVVHVELLLLHLAALHHLLGDPWQVVVGEVPGQKAGARWAVLLLLLLLPLWRQQRCHGGAPRVEEAS